MSNEELPATRPDRDPARAAEPSAGGADAIMPPELQSLEAALASLRPATPRLDRDRVMFAAGQASLTPPSRAGWRGVWRRVAPLAAAAAAAVLVTVFSWRLEPRIVERVVYVPAPQPPTVAAGSPRPASAAAAPERSDSASAPLAATDLNRPPASPPWLAALMGIRPVTPPGQLARRMIGSQHFESLAAGWESASGTNAAALPADCSPCTPPTSSDAEPTMSRQSLDHLLNDFTAAPPRGVPVC